MAVSAYTGQLFINTCAWIRREALPLFWAEPGEGFIMSMVWSIGSLTWSSPCQEDTFIQDFINSPHGSKSSFSYTRCWLWHSSNFSFIYLLIYWLVGWLVYKQGINSQAGLKFVAIPRQPPRVWMTSMSHLQCFFFCWNGRQRTTCRTIVSWDRSQAAAPS